MADMAGCHLPPSLEEGGTVIPTFVDLGAFALRSFTVTDFFAADFPAFRAFGAFAFFVFLAMVSPVAGASAARPRSETRTRLVVLPS
jgi:hypothetical protein